MISRFNDGEYSAELRERKVEDDKRKLIYFFQRQAWFSRSVFNQLELHFRPDELEGLGFIERNDWVRRGPGYKAGSKLYT